MSSDAAGAPSQRDRWLLGGWILAIAVTLAGTVHDTDPYWQIRAGQEALDGFPLARPDTWSWAPVDGLFYPNSPAWNVALALAWDALGSWGLYLVTVACIVLTLSLTAVLAYRLGARRVQTVGVLIVTSGAILPILSPRPALAAQALFLLSIVFALGWADRAARHAVPLNATVAFGAGLLFSWVGNWVHLSWSTLAAAAGLAWTVIWLLTGGLRTATRVAMIVAGLAGLALGVLLGPYGTDVFERSNVVLTVCRDLIYEWSSPFDSEMGVRWWPLAFGVAVVVLLALWWCVRTWRRGRADPRLPLAAALALGAVPYALGGFLFIRFIPIAMLTLAPLAAGAFTVLVDRIHSRVADPGADARYLRRRLPEWTSDGFWRVILWGVLVILAPLALFAGSRHAEPATQAVNDALPRDCRMFGGSLEAASIILTRPDVLIWIDGRADYWGRERLIASHGYLYAGDQPTLVPPGTTCVVLGDPTSDPGLQRLTDALDADPAWQRVPGTVDANLWVPATDDASVS